MGIEIGSKKVGGGKLGAFAEELGAGLEVGDTAVEVKGITSEGRKLGSEKTLTRAQSSKNLIVGRPLNNPRVLFLNALSIGNRSYTSGANRRLMCPNWSRHC
jgi:hypothetical protein